MRKKIAYTKEKKEEGEEKEEKEFGTLGYEQ